MFYSTCAIQLQEAEAVHVLGNKLSVKLSEHSSMLLMKLCNCRFIVVAIYVSNFKHGFILEY